LGVAEAMDTAQRGMGLDWEASAQLIRRSAAASDGRPLACGAGTDQLAAPASLSEVVDAYLEQLELVSSVGATPILMCSRALAATASGPEDYLSVYAELLRQVDRPVILHWLGPMFDPALSGYWGSNDLVAAADTLAELIATHAAAVDGVKISLLDAAAEIAFRRRLPDSVRCYTGDDFNYPELIAGDDRGFSHALLGIFDPLAPFASAAVRRLDAADTAGFRSILDPTVALARKVFAAPTYNYKTGVVFLAWLAGHQDHFRMVAGREAARSIRHLTDVFVLADRAGLFGDPDLAAHRMRALLEVAGQ
ncbi:MAG TPA: DUF993 family protein, partial [Stackebrandtia sp.]|uniref:DUF993 family protein n=1 Tax=Stackebrandtia sp. TaxID=2023065 RepID=UPI002D4D6542